MTETSRFGSKVVCMFVCAGLSLGTPLVQAAQEPAAPTEPAAPAAAASGSDTDTARASELYQNGKRLFREGSYEAAILSFKEGYRLSNRYQFLFNLSQAYERMGEFGEAADYLDKYRAFAPQDDADVLSRKIEALRQRQKEKQDREAELKAQAAEKAKQEQIAKQKNQPQPQTPADQPVKEKVFGPASWALTATAVVGFGLGIGMGIRANNKKQAALDNCVDGEAGTVCSSDASGDIDARRTSALVADVGFVIGGVATAAAIVVTALRAKRIKQNQRSQALAPYAGPKSAGVMWTGHF